MCGLFGAIGGTINPFIIRSLAVANRARGTDALGFFNSKGEVLKGAQDPHDILRQKNFSAWLEESCQRGWYLCGHTRMGTRGLKTLDANAHPFRYGNYIGSHNGVVQAPHHYVVDSMWLIDLLHEHEGDYLEAFKKVTGSWALTWTDGKDLYLQARGNPLHAVVVGDCVYYSSDDDHLLSAVGHVEEKGLWRFDEGETWKYSRRKGGGADVEVLQKFIYTSSFLGGYCGSGYRQDFNWANRAGVGGSPSGTSHSTSTGMTTPGGVSAGSTELTLSKREAKRLRKAAKQRGVLLNGPEEERLWAEIEKLEEQERQALGSSVPSSSIPVSPPDPRSEGHGDGMELIDPSQIQVVD